MNKIKFRPSKTIGVFKTKTGFRAYAMLFTFGTTLLSVVQECIVTGLILWVQSAVFNGLCQ